MADISQPIDPLKDKLLKTISFFVADNEAARVISQGLRVVGIGILPALDYLCFLTKSHAACIEPYLSLGYSENQSKQLDIRTSEGHAKVYDCAGYPSIVVVESSTVKEQTPFISAWVDKFDHALPFMLTLHVENIENAVFYLEKQGVAFPKSISGGRGEIVREAIAIAKVKEDQVFSAVKLIERHCGYSGYNVDLTSFAASSARP